MHKQICIFLILLLFFSFAQADPWGKDADLVYSAQKNKPLTSAPTILSKMGITAIRFHQNIISPADGPRSHFIPSSSQYTLQAMQKYGFFQGYMMGCDRLMRESNEKWVYRTTCDSAKREMKWDPVP